MAHMMVNIIANGIGDNNNSKKVSGRVFASPNLGPFEFSVDMPWTTTAGPAQTLIANAAKDRLALEGITVGLLDTKAIYSAPTDVLL